MKLCQITAGLVVTMASVLVGAEPPVSTRLPENVLPVIGMWGWQDQEFAPAGYRPWIDMAAEHAAYDLVATTLRIYKKEVTDDDVHDQIKGAASYARRRGMRIVMDLDVRLAREAFRKAYPDELQEMLCLRQVGLQTAGEVPLRIPSQDLGDHYTYRTTHYVPLSGRLVRVYSYVGGSQGIGPGTLADITDKCRTTAVSEKEVAVAIPCSEQPGGRTACVIACFTHFAADVFAPHLMEFQRGILKRYTDTEIAGACKDEWGFPPCYDGNPAKNDFWYSRHYAAAYAERTGGRDLVRDCLLMHVGERGRDRERQAAINHYLDLSRVRNGALEHDFYQAVKATFGPSAVVATHPTWYPYPGTREFKKNGLHWWIATRDLAQTDEVTPYCVRTSLAKKWGSPVWYNMYYSTSIDDYKREIWAHALGGGRIDFHPVYPRPETTSPIDGYAALLRGGIMRGDCRIRLLNFISRSPLDCPVAVIFGQACAMNWAGPAYDDVGIGVTDALWAAGYPADLIPATEIGSNSLRIGEDGSIQYGAQRYAVAILHHPEFENPSTAAFFQRAAAGKTALYRIGHWTTTFEGQAFDGDKALPGKMPVLPDVVAGIPRVVVRLRELGVEAQSPATDAMSRFDRRSCSPPPGGRCRLIDGTQIILSGRQDVTGDPIQTTIKVKEHAVKVDALGVVGVRLTENGAVDAFAAGGLKYFECGAVRIVLDSRADLALYRDREGRLQGVLQGFGDPVPAPLTAITPHWRRLALPTPLP